MINNGSGMFATICTGGNTELIHCDNVTFLTRHKLTRSIRREIKVRAGSYIKSNSLFFFKTSGKATL